MNQNVVQPRFTGAYFDSHTLAVDVIKNIPLAKQFDELAQLEAGWYEGQGTAPDKNKL